MLGSGYLLTVHDPGWEPKDALHLRAGPSAIMAHGPDHLLWALCDDIVDGYFPFADDLGDAIDAVQDAIIAKPTSDALDELFVLKRELIEVRRAASPTREVFNQITNRDLPLIEPGELVYFRDIYDHVIRLTDEIDNYRELTSATLDVYLTQINNNLSVIMKRLTGVTVILAGDRRDRRVVRDERGGAVEAAGELLAGHRRDRPGRRRCRRVPATDRLDLAAVDRFSRSRPAWAWDGHRQDRPPPPTAAPR